MGGDRDLIGPIVAGALAEATRAIALSREPEAILDLIVDRGSHRNFVHPKVAKPVTISGALGDDAKQYQVRAVQLAIEESKR